MNSQDSLLSQLEVAISNKDLSRRAEVLRRVTDLFMFGAGAFTADQIDLFDEVMSRLIENVDLALRAELSICIAGEANAPRHVVHTLAFDDAIDVAGPVLRQSERLDETALLQNAKAKGQAHLFAISGRKVLSEALTDVLIERGEPIVVRSTVANHGAKFSNVGLSSLKKKSREDVDLVLSLWARSDIPRQLLVATFIEASEMTRKALEAEYPRRAAAIGDAVAAATAEIQAKARAGSEGYAREHAGVASLFAAGRLDEARLLAYASENRFDKTASALSLMCDLPVGLIERCLLQKRTEQILVIAKAVALKWQTAAALITMQGRGEGISRSQLDQCFATFSRLQTKTAQTALQFYRMREMARGSDSA